MIHVRTDYIIDEDVQSTIIVINKINIRAFLQCYSVFIELCKKFPIVMKVKFYQYLHSRRPWTPFLFRRPHKPLASSLFAVNDREESKLSTGTKLFKEFHVTISTKVHSWTILIF